LVISFLDRTTDMPAGGNVSLIRNGENARFRVSPEGFALFTDTGREDFVLGVDVTGYEHEDVQVEYAALDENFPYIEVYMIPQDIFGEGYTTIDGHIEGLAAADAVCIGPSAWSVSGYDARKRLLTVQSAYNKDIGGRHYAIVSNGETGYTPIEIRGKEADGAYRADGAPEGDISGLRLAFRVTGRVRDGTCLLRLPKRGGRGEWIVRAVIGGEPRFHLLDADETSDSVAAARIGIDEIIGRALPGMREAQGSDARMKGG
jgi:hypothetical protein